MKRRTLVALGLGFVLMTGATVPATPARADSPWTLGRLTDTGFYELGDSPAFAVAAEPDERQVEAGTTNGDFLLFRYHHRAGRRDASMNGRGWVTTDLGGNDVAYAIARQPDGKIVVAGVSDSDIAVVRYQHDGLLDTDFGDGGKVITDLGGDDKVSGLVLQPNGELVVAGRRGSDVALVRYMANGRLDASFGSAGTVVLDLGGDDEALALARQDDAKLVITGSRDNDVVLARFEGDGALDVSFGTRGIAVHDLGDMEVAHALTIQSDGRVVVAGKKGTSALLARFLSTGTLDVGFGQAGSVVTSLRGGVTAAYGIVQLADGRLVVTGTTADDFALAGFLANGSPDPNFRDGNEAWTGFFGNTGGVGRAIALAPDGNLAVAGSIPADSTVAAAANRYGPTGYVEIFGRGSYTFSSYDSPSDLLRQADGKVLAIATAGEGSGQNGGDVAIARYTAGGSLDPTFGRGGKVVADYAASSDRGLAGALQPDGKIVVAGSAAGQPAVVRFLPDGRVDSSFGTKGWARMTVDSKISDATAVAVAPDQSIVVAARIESGPALFRLTPSGGLDQSFGNGGMASSPAGIGAPSAILLQPDGKVVVGASALFGIARHLPDGRLDTAFGDDGVARIGEGNDPVAALVLQPDGKIVGQWPAEWWEMKTPA